MIKSSLWRFVEMLHKLKVLEWPYIIRRPWPLRLSKRKTVLLYYKTEPFYKPWIISKYVHSNNWEIVQIARILSKLGYLVEVYDRRVQRFDRRRRYEYVLLNAAGSSGLIIEKIAECYPNTPIWVIVNGAMPEISRKNVENRLSRFRTRYSMVPQTSRITLMKGDLIKRYASGIICIGEPGSHCSNSYRGLSQPLSHYFPSTSPKIRFRRKWLETRSLNRFLAFAGHGFVAKGIDVLVECFARLPDLHLTICMPDIEWESFERVYRYHNRPGNIRFEGFVPIASARFRSLAAQNSFVLGASASEGTATSICSCMRAGLVPIVNYETGVSVDRIDGSLLVRSFTETDTLCKMLEKFAQMEKQDYQELVRKTLEESRLYTQESFSASMMEALIEVNVLLSVKEGLERSENSHLRERQ